MHPDSAHSALQTHIETAIKQAGGWLPFDAFMAQTLYAPGLGYYANDLRKFGTLPSGIAASSSDFVTAPELTPLFGQALAKQLAQALHHTGTTEVWEFGAGSGALAAQILTALESLGQTVSRYTIVDLSGTLRQRQQERLAAFGDTVRWASELPNTMQGVVIGNEVLDAMPVKILARVNAQWFERGVVQKEIEISDQNTFAWQDRPTDLRPPVEVAGAHDYLTEIHPQAEAFMHTLAQKLLANPQSKGAVFLIDYGFPESEYYHPQRHMGTVMCHLAHQADGNPLLQVGQKDITAHVNFTGIALAAQDGGLNCLGYTSQGRFLLNCGLPDLMVHADLKNRSHAMKLINEHEMGELFKVIGFCTDEPWDAVGFAAGDRTHTL
ncbi:MAG TPA: SAM-dependent methyltransferase [Burkholderiaceae bacterium]|mgnify:CR=1 FL=1|nr:SAM-dependent methyltransferase [Burkholderiaceae bacterium]